ncbi:hypothetical protein CDL15_Pgr004413 [Punica granatum]|uniref:Uncharacterized protein n=1 Tax=Punica granatum TaxID=22663 RepID=A0A218XI10_PUNGR|nr:hypothetical protein CDL15_Pgr004413 [Punica granatum]
MKVVLIWRSRRAEEKRLIPVEGGNGPTDLGVLVAVEEVTELHTGGVEEVGAGGVLVGDEGSLVGR